MSAADEKKNMESIETIFFSLSFILWNFKKKKKKILELDLD